MLFWFFLFTFFCGVLYWLRLADYYYYYVFSSWLSHATTRWPVKCSSALFTITIVCLFTIYLFNSSFSDCLHVFWFILKLFHIEFKIYISRKIKRRGIVDVIVIYFITTICLWFYNLPIFQPMLMSSELLIPINTVFFSSDHVVLFCRDIKPLTDLVPSLFVFLSSWYFV